MFARLDFVAGTSVANLLSDVVAVLTGTTDKATLSASIIQNTSYIESTVSAGWTIHDANPGTNKKVLSAPNPDGTAKYVLLDANTAGYLLISCFESWNSSTHVGTNATSLSGSQTFCPKVNLGAGSTLFIGASSHYLFCESYTSNAYDQRNFLVGTRQRIEPWDTVVAGYPVAVQTSQSWNLWHSPRMRNFAGSDATSSTASLNMTTAYGQTLSGTQGRDSAGNAKHLLADIHLYNAGGGSVTPMVGGIVLGGIGLTTSSYGNQGDEAVVGATTYWVSAAGTVRMLIPKA